MPSFQDPTDRVQDAFVIAVAICRPWDALLPFLGPCLDGTSAALSPLHSPALALALGCCNRHATLNSSALGFSLSLSSSLLNSPVHRAT